MRYFLLTILIFISNCSMNKRGNEIPELKNKRQIEKIINTSDSIKWNIIEYSELEDKFRNFHMYYVGSIEDYHLIYWHDKLIHPIIHFAVKNTEYFPKHKIEYSPDNFTNEKCEQVFKKQNIK